MYNQKKRRLVLLVAIVVVLLAIMVFVIAGFVGGKPKNGDVAAIESGGGVIYYGDVDVTSISGLTMTTASAEFSGGEKSNAVTEVIAGSEVSGESVTTAPVTSKSVSSAALDTGKTDNQTTLKTITVTATASTPKGQLASTTKKAASTSRTTAKTTPPTTKTTITEPAEPSNPAQPGATISKDGTYTITGNFSGQILVTAKDVTLILSGANIDCKDGAAILAFYSGGKGTLNIELRGENHIISGASHGIQGRDDLNIYGSGTIDVNAVSDGIHSGGKLTISSGIINVNSCFEGIEASKINIEGGSIYINAIDDGINAASSAPEVKPKCKISGGTINIAAGGDGIDSNGDLEITGGSLSVTLTGAGQKFNVLGEIVNILNL